MDPSNPESTRDSTQSAPERLPIDQLFALKGRTAICTEATGGIGKELCVTLAEAGCDIVSIQLPLDSVGASLESEIKGLGRAFRAFECDIGDSLDVHRCFSRIWDSQIEPDILLNAAGINRRGKVTELMDADIDAVSAVVNSRDDIHGRDLLTFAKVLAVNLKGSYVASQEMAKRLLSLHKPGKIINIGSMTSFIGMYNVSAYAASKGGVLQMTKAFSNELAGEGIQVNCICPGYTRPVYFHFVTRLTMSCRYINTPLTAAIREDSEYEALVLQRTPAKRWGSPQDLRGAVLFLAGRASDFVSGSAIVVDGGMLGK
jgi:2-deoxy-D-gluconate 3-dehydrogenase